MKRKSGALTLLVLVLLASLLLTACPSPEAEPAAPAPDAPATAPESPTDSPAKEARVLKFAYTMPKGASIAEGFEWWGPEFEKRTDGRYKVETYPAQSLVKIPAALDSVKSGVSEIVMTSINTFPNDFPLSLVVNLPGMEIPLETVQDYKNGFNDYMRLYDTNPDVRAEYADIKLLWPFMVSPTILVAKNKEIHRPADFQGIKMGGSGSIMQVVTENGGAPVQMIPPETYMNMDKGVIDASFLSYAQVRDYNLQEICEYYYNKKFFGGVITILMNLETYREMGTEDRQIMMMSWRDAAEVSAEAMQASEAEGLQAILDAGRTITEPTPEEEADWNASAQIVYDKWVADCCALGIGEETIEGAAAKWRQIIGK